MKPLVALCGDDVASSVQRWPCARRRSLRCLQGQCRVLRERQPAELHVCSRHPLDLWVACGTHQLPHSLCLFAIWFSLLSASPSPHPQPRGRRRPVPAEAPTAQPLLPRRRLVAATRQRPRSVPGPGDSHRQATPDRDYPPTAANGPVMGRGRAGLDVLESPTQPTVVVDLRSRPPDPLDENRTSCVCWYA